MGRGTQWGLLGLDVDPVQGDPSKLDYLISRMNRLADDADRARRGVVGLLGDKALNSWLGASGEAFRDACAPLPDHLQKLRQSYEDAATALKNYQRALTDARSRSDAACANGVSAYGKYNCLGDAPPCHRMDDAEYHRWVDKLGRDLILQHQKTAAGNNGSGQQPTTFVGPYAWAPEQQALVAARASALQAQTDNVNAANTAHQALEDAAHLAAALSKITGAGASTPGVTFDERFKNAGGDVSKLVLDPAAGQDVETAEMPPTGTSPADVAKWWDGLDAAARERYIHDHPGEIAGLDGVPEDAREQAYRVLHPVRHAPAGNGDDGGHGGGRRRHAKGGDGAPPAQHGDAPSGGRHRGGGDHQEHGGPVVDDPRRDPDGSDHREHGGPVRDDPSHDPADPGHRHETDPGHRHDTDPGHREFPPPGERDGGPHNPPGHTQPPPNQSVPGDPGSRADYGPHDPSQPPNPAPDPGVRISMPAPVVEPTAPAAHHPGPPDYHVTSEPHHTAPPADLWRTGSHTAYHDVAAPESAPWLPGAHAPRIEASMDSSPWPASAYVPRIEAVVDASAWAAAGHEPRVSAAMDSGFASPQDAWLPSGSVPHAPAQFGPLNGNVHHAPDVVSAVSGVVGSVGRYVSEGHFGADAFQPSGSFSGGLPHQDAVVASSGVLTRDERVSADRLYG